jgi:RNA polymerase sigma-70 factor (ECF subfamily)
MISYAILKKDARSITMAQSDHDMELMRRVAAGEEPALCELYATYSQRLYAYALRLTGDPTQADDVLQDALIVVWRNAGHYRGEGRLVAWLLGIVHHTAMKALRYRSILLTDEIEDNLPSPSDSPEIQAQVSQQAQWVRRGLQSLDPEHRAVLELVFYQGLKLEEVAEVCNCPLGTVKSRLSYARQHLRGVLSRQNIEEWR